MNKNNMYIHRIFNEINKSRVSAFIYIFSCIDFDIKLATIKFLMNFKL